MNCKFILFLSFIIFLFIISCKQEKIKIQIKQPELNNETKSNLTKIYSDTFNLFFIKGFRRKEVKIWVNNKGIKYKNYEEFTALDGCCEFRKQKINSIRFKIGDKVAEKIILDNEYSYILCSYDSLQNILKLDYLDFSPLFE